MSEILLRCGDTVEQADPAGSLRYFFCFFDPGVGNCHGCGKVLGWLRNGRVQKNAPPAATPSIEERLATLEKKIGL